MKKKLLYISAIACVLSLSGCATYTPQGIVYTKVKGAPTSAEVNDNIKAEKIGEACVKSILGIVATGDMSVENAAKNGDITKVRSVNYKAESVLGIVGNYCTIVKGE